MKSGVHRFPDEGPSDAAWRLGSVFHSAARLIVEVNDVAHHAHRLVEGAEPKFSTTWLEDLSAF